VRNVFSDKYALVEILSFFIGDFLQRGYLCGPRE
jgi:hypothetical protein